MGESVDGTVLCFPYGRGSTVGSYSLYQLKVNGVSPCAIVNASAEPIVATGAIMSDIPMIDQVDISLVRTGDEARLDADSGCLELPKVQERKVVTNIVRRKDKILLLQRSKEVGSYRGLWAGVSGFIEPDELPADAARRELAEEIGLQKAQMTKALAPQSFRDLDVIWTVHAFLVDVGRAKIELDWEHDHFEWARPEDLSGYHSVPGLQKVVFELLKN